MRFVFKILTTAKHSARVGLLAALPLFISCTSGYTSSDPTQQPFFINAPGSPVVVEGGPNNVLIGDMNGDRKPDLVVACGRGRNVVVLPGRGDGQFGAPISQTTVPDNPGDMALGDLNGDGKLDVAVSTHDSYGVTLLLGDGKGGLSIAPNSPFAMKLGQHPHTHGLGVADMNRDKKLDLITCNNNDNDISVAVGDGRSNFTRAAQSFPVGPSPYPFGVGDVNNDGWMDIAATASATGPKRREQLPLSRTVTLLLADGKGGFSPRQLPIQTGEPWFAEIADINADGKADILATHHELNALTVLIGDGLGGFTESKGSPFDFGVFFFNVVVADVNHDKKVDVVATTGNSIHVLLGDGTGGFTSAASIAVNRGAWRIGAGDVNGDGRVDIVAGNSESNSVTVLLGK